MKIESFDHIHIYSKDPGEAANYYIEFFSGEKLYQKTSDLGLRIFLSLGGQIIVIGPYPSDRVDSSTIDVDKKPYHHQFGLDHFGIRVKNLKTAVQELKEKGIQILKEPVSGPSGIKFAFVAAPDGVIIELTEYGLLPKMFLKLKNVI